MPDFPQTHWTLLERARCEGDAHRQALAEFFSAYWLPMCQLVMWKFRLRAEEAEEIVQGFVTEKFLDGKLFAVANPSRGRLRNLLSKSLSNYAISQLRSSGVQHRSLEELTSTLAVEPSDPHSDSTLATLDWCWAVRIFVETLGRMAAECEANGHGDRWYVFEHRMLRPLLTSSEPAAHHQLAARLRLADPSTAMNLLVSARRQFGRTLARILAAQKHGRSPLTADDDAQLGEICSTLQTLVLSNHSLFVKAVEQMRALCLAPRASKTSGMSNDGAISRNFEPVARGATLVCEIFSSESAQDRASAHVEQANALRMSVHADVGGLTRGAIARELFAGNLPTESMKPMHADELAKSFSQQIEAPLPCYLVDVNQEVVAQTRAACESRELVLRSLGEMLFHPRPPLELLRLVKGFAKIRRESPDETLPAPAATAIYFLTIAVALVRCESSISGLGMTDLMAVRRRALFVCLA